MSKHPVDDKISTPDVEIGDNQSQHQNEKLQQPNDVDRAAGFLLNAAAYGELTPEAEKRLKRKIDWVMIPMVSLFFLQQCSYIF